MEDRAPVPPPCVLDSLTPQRPGVQGTEVGCGPFSPSQSPASALCCLNIAAVRAGRPVLSLSVSRAAPSGGGWRCCRPSAPPGEEEDPPFTSSRLQGWEWSILLTPVSGPLLSVYARNLPSSAGSETGFPHTSEMFPLDSALTSSRGSGPSWRPRGRWAWHPHTMREGVSGLMARVHVTASQACPMQSTRLKGM